MKNKKFKKIEAFPISKKRVCFLVKENFLRAVEESIGATMFRNVFVRINGKKTDASKDGNFSCAVYVSRMLFMFKLIHDVHASVFETVRDIKRSGYQKVKRPRLGDILVWEPERKSDDIMHGHVGFYLGANKAISHRDMTRTPMKHHWTYGTKNKKPVRKIIAIYRKKDWSEGLHWKLS